MIVLAIWGIIRKKVAPPWGDGWSLYGGLSSEKDPVLFWFYILSYIVVGIVSIMGGLSTWGI